MRLSERVKRLERNVTGTNEARVIAFWAPHVARPFNLGDERWDGRREGEGDHAVVDRYFADFLNQRDGAASPFAVHVAINPNGMSDMRAAAAKYDALKARGRGETLERNNAANNTGVVQ